MVRTLGAMLPQARQGLGEDALIAWVLVLTAALGILLCGYLAVVWFLAALITLSGPASGMGRALLIALRVLAPRLARRIAVGASTATIAGSLMLLPASASVESSIEDHPSAGGTAIAQSISPTDGDGSTVTTEPEPALADPDPSSGAVPSQELPDLGWEGTPVPDTDPEQEPDRYTAIGTEGDSASGSGGESDSETAEADPSSPASDSTDGSTPPPPGGAGSSESSAPNQSAPTSTVIVEQGDTLWSITDDLLGPEADPDADIATSWPLLHEANFDVIGDDPSHLIPGQVLTVPGHLTSQEQS